jgi:hypothetical protein
VLLGWGTPIGTAGVPTYRDVAAYHIVAASSNGALIVNPAYDRYGGVMYVNEYSKSGPIAK